MELNHTMVGDAIIQYDQSLILNLLIENGVWRESKVEVAEDQPFTLCDARYNPSAREEV